MSGLSHFDNHCDLPPCEKHGLDRLFIITFLFYYCLLYWWKPCEVETFTYCIIDFYIYVDVIKDLFDITTFCSCVGLIILNLFIYTSFNYMTSSSKKYVSHK